MDPRPCPACRATLLSSREGDLEIDTCPRCFGLWFDREELRRFFPNESLVKRILAQESLPVPGADRSQPRICPVCATGLHESPVGKVMVDHCRRCHGIWLDHGELVRVVQEYRAGERGNLMVLNQVAEGLRQAQQDGHI